MEQESYAGAMTADPGLVARVRSLLAGENVTERSMFGGLAFLVDGHMGVAVGAEGLLMRVDPEADWLTADPRVSEAMPGRPMRGWRSVDVDDTTEDLPELVSHALAQVRALPPTT